MSRQSQLFRQHIAQTSPSPLNIEINYAKGIYLYDINNKKYLDSISGISVSVLGHQHPYIKQALQEQINKHLHVMVYGELIQFPQTLLAKKLTSTLPATLQNCFFVNSGSEATEGALKLAKGYTGKTNIIYAENAYHGSTHGALSVAGNETLKRKFRPLLPGTKKIRFGCVEDLENITKNTAAVILETIQGEAGVRQTTKSYFKHLSARCHQTGALLILDEVQCGVGRTGKFWAFEHYDIVPDILLTAKGIGGGMPIGAFISSKKIMKCLSEYPILGHISTFGGHPLSCVAAIATIDILLEKKLIEQVEKKSKLFKHFLRNASEIYEIRGKGLMLALEFNSFEKVQKIIQKGLKIGILADWFLFCNTSIRIAPPLNITDDEIKICCDLILKCIKSD